MCDTTAKYTGPQARNRIKSARELLFELLAEIESGPFSVSRVCIAAGVDPSVVSRWKSTSIEPRLSSIERLSEAYGVLLSGLLPIEDGQKRKRVRVRELGAARRVVNAAPPDTPAVHAGANASPSMARMSDVGATKGALLFKEDDWIARAAAAVLEMDEDLNASAVLAGRAQPTGRGELHTKLQK